jgi:rhamnose transport system permease protein
VNTFSRCRNFPWWHEAALAVLLLGLLAAAGTAMPSFLDWRSQLLLSRHLWEFAILSLGMTLIIISGGIDLSVGSMMGLCAIVFGITFARSQSVVLSALVGDDFAWLARGTWWDVPIPGYLFLVLAVACAVLLAKTPTGRFIYAVGNNEQAARFSGVDVERLKFRLYSASGLLAGIATVIYISRFDTAKADAGKGFELETITAVVLGGTSIFGGRGNIVGTVLGLVLIHETRLFVSRYWRTDELRSIVIGGLLIASVLAYRALRTAVMRDR